MRTYIFSLAVALLFSDVGVAFSETGTMICTNPRRGYSAFYDTEGGIFKVGDADNGVFVNETYYEVRTVERDGSGLTISGITASGGPEFSARLYGRKKIDFLVGREIVQTDFCK